MRLLFVYFFFFKQKTAYEMRISDWSSDVCSSDLITALHQTACFLDQPLRSPSFGRGLPFGAAADRQAWIDDEARDIMRGDAGAARFLEEIENGEHHAEAARLDRKSTRLNSSH